MATTTSERTEKGVSLARGPALILGTILEVAGLYFLYKQHGFPKFSNFPNGDAPVPGKVFFGIFGVNGWSGLFTAAAGGLLLFGAAQHLLAKTMSLIVGVALGAAAVIAVVSGNVLGLAAANGWTRLGWGVCAVILLFNTFVPRRTRTVQEPVVAEDRGMAPTRTARPVGATRADEPVRRGGEPVTRADQPVTRADEPVTRADEPVTRADEPTTRTGAAETEPLVAHDRDAAVPDRAGTSGETEYASGQRADGESTGGQRAGPMDDRPVDRGSVEGHPTLRERAANALRREPPPE